MEDWLGVCEVQEEELACVFPSLLGIDLYGLQALEQSFWEAILQRSECPVNGDAPAMTSCVNMGVTIEDLKRDAFLRLNQIMILLSID